ncbi:conserved hypothetical protein [Shewanella denitrificans OS217]|jgi:hypothetical protein|uniref:Zinc-regulated TonB-dependent outer membrane receptor n=1 Tax=Shewanella denitrificans (strain OS217 / ATCC BAA-1090 / DSM 15013) TaxID=318161 RepID=Q12RV7_SHEDO|nr:hypothetical protein [Shewanella denitrificans]ABE53819.1 conserved hypothetical protein [Shewanella denitrificans OS217]
MQILSRFSLLALACASVSNVSMAADGSLTNPNISGVLNGHYQSGDRALGGTEEGFGLGETELALSANIDNNFYGKITAVLETHDGDTEVNLEEAFIQTLALPGGFSIRGGRFLSDIGYLNNQHSHTDAFIDRPAVYRAFLGGHYFDDGVRVSYVAPTDIYWTLGTEAFKGEKMRAADEHGERKFSDVGVYSAFSKWGGDLSLSSSWQLGVNYLRNENGQAYLEHHEAHDEHADSHDDHSGHSHSAAYTGENTYVADFVYKWAPDGNYKYQHLSVSGEFFRVDNIAALAEEAHEEQEHHEDDHGEDHDEGHAEGKSKDYHQGWYLSSVYQFSPSWSAGARYGEVDTQTIHGDHLHGQELKETEFSLAWHSSHFSSVRLQYTHQDGTNFDGFTDDSIFSLQYVMTLGAHSAHQF